MAEETLNVATQEAPVATPGHSGMPTQMPGAPTTASGYDYATRGQDIARLIESDVDREIFLIKQEDTPLYQMALISKTVPVDSPEVEHYAIDEPRALLTTKAVTPGTSVTAVLQLEDRDKSIPREYTTLLVNGVDGYNEAGTEKTPGRNLMLIVTGRDASTDAPVVRAVNGPVDATNSNLRKMVEIPAGTKITVLANACYETQKEVDPDGMVPKGDIIYLQKSIMNQIISNYFESQKKHIPFQQSVIAEEMLAEFKRKLNRSLWVSRKSRIAVNVPKLGTQYIYTTEGILGQFKKRYEHSGKWTYEEFIALMKMFFTGEDVPNSCTALCGKNFLENIQCIDFSKHPEVQFTQSFNKLGWSVTRIHTVFGDVEFKREPTLDTLDFSNSCALLGEDRLVRYKRTNEHSFSDDIDGEEAKRNGTIVWEGVALKGSCHIFVDCEGKEAASSGVTILPLNSATFPASPVEGAVYVLLVDNTDDTSAKAGEMWQYKDSKWVEYTGQVNAQ